MKYNEIKRDFIFFMFVTQKENKKFKKLIAQNPAKFLPITIPIERSKAL